MSTPRLGSTSHAVLTTSAGALFVWGLSVTGLEGLWFGVAIMGAAGMLYVPVAIDYLSTSDGPSWLRIDQPKNGTLATVSGVVLFLALVAFSVWRGYVEQQRVKQIPALLARHLEAGETLKAEWAEQSKQPYRPLDVAPYERWLKATLQTMAENDLTVCAAALRHPQERQYILPGAGSFTQSEEPKWIALQFRVTEVARCMENPR